jgi:hypothetical protein
MYQGHPHPTYMPGPFLSQHAARPEQLKHEGAAAPVAHPPVRRWPAA